LFSVIQLLRSCVCLFILLNTEFHWVLFIFNSFGVAFVRASFLITEFHSITELHSVLFKFNSFGVAFVRASFLITELHSVLFKFNSFGVAFVYGSFNHRVALYHRVSLGAFKFNSFGVAFVYASFLITEFHSVIFIFNSFGVAFVHPFFKTPSCTRCYSNSTPLELLLFVHLF